MSNYPKLVFQTNLEDAISMIRDEQETNCMPTSIVWELSDQVAMTDDVKFSFNIVKLAKIVHVPYTYDSANNLLTFVDRDDKNKTCIMACDDNDIFHIDINNNVHAKKDLKFIFEIGAYLNQCMEISCIPELRSSYTNSFTDVDYYSVCFLKHEEGLRQLLCDKIKPPIRSPIDISLLPVYTGGFIHQ